jgi:BMFP domain-containing protein YqiC
MFKLFSSTLKAAPAVLGVMLLVNGLAIQQAKANEAVSQSPDAMLDSISEYSESTPMNQVTSVSQLRDVSPTDWAYEALRSLVERYGCIVGYPDRTYRGNRALSRYEFAAGLNACMQQMERLIASSEAVLREDIEKLQRLMKEFETELAALGARVDNLEGRVAFLEDHQFSTTTKLRGEAVISVQAYGGPDQKLDQFYNLPTTSPIPDNIKADLGLGSKELTATTRSGGSITGATLPDEVDDQTTMSNRVRLTLDSSFTGKDKLRTRLAAANVPDLSSAFGTGQASLNFYQNNGNDVEVDRLWYSAPLGDKFKFWIGTALPAEDIYETFTPYTESSGSGSLARANRFNPFIYRAGGDAGLAFKYKFNDTFDFTASYLAGDAEDPSRGKGLFNGQYSAGAQIGVHPSENFDLGIAYMFAYYPGSVNGMTSRANLTGSLGSDYSSGVSSSIAYLGGDGGFRGARDPFSGAATTAHNVGLQGNWRISEKINWAAWGGWATASGESYDSTGANRNGDSAELWTWNTNFSFLDLGKEGAVLTIAGGQLPRAGYVDGTFGRDLDQSWIVEGNYNYPINNNISLTPGVYAIFNPNNSADNDTIVVGVLRSVFKF